MIETNKNRKQIPKMVALRSDHYSNLVGSVDLFTYVKKKQYKVEWNYRKKIRVNSKSGGKIRERWINEKNSKEKESMFARLVMVFFTKIKILW